MKEENNAYKYCKYCGRVLAPTYKEDNCPMCIENILFDQVREYIRANDVTEQQVANHFQIPQKKVKGWIKEGRIEYKENGNVRALITMHCENCGAPVRFGSLCTKCRSMLNKAKYNYMGNDEMDTRMRFLDQDG